MQLQYRLGVDNYLYIGNLSKCYKYCLRQQNGSWAHRTWAIQCKRNSKPSINITPLWLSNTGTFCISFRSIFKISLYLFSGRKQLKKEVLQLLPPFSSVPQSICPAGPCPVEMGLSCYLGLWNWKEFGYVCQLQLESEGQQEQEKDFLNQGRNQGWVVRGGIYCLWTLWARLLKTSPAHFILGRSLILLFPVWEMYALKKDQAYF